MQTTSILLRPEVDFLTISELAGILRVAPVSLYRLVRRRAIPVYRICRKIRFRRTDVLAYLAERRSDPTRPTEV